MDALLGVAACMVVINTVYIIIRYVVAVVTSRISEIFKRIINKILKYVDFTAGICVGIGMLLCLGAIERKLTKNSNIQPQKFKL